MKQSLFRRLSSGSGGTVAVAFLIFLTIFIVTHVFKFPGSLAYYMEVSGGQKILDMSPSFNSSEVYQRLDAMGDVGRNAYFRLILTIDFVFPVAVLMFLFTWSRFLTVRSDIGTKAQLVLGALPFVYFSADLIENISALIILWHYPNPISIVGAGVGFFTVIKRSAMMLSLFLPLSIFLAQVLRRRRTARSY
jgi:hypothetical protein